MAGATYERGAGGHVAERVRPEPGSPEAAELDRLAADPSTAWRRIPDTAADPAPDAPTGAADTETKPRGRTRAKPAAEPGPEAPTQ